MGFIYKTFFMKTTYTYTITNSIFDISTDIEVEITQQKTGWFKKGATVFIKESLQNKPALFVMPHFEYIANDIVNRYLSDVKRTNIKWVHYTPYHDKENLESINNYRTLKTTVKNNKIIGAEWYSLLN